jgi:hypothetical protein
MRKLVFMMMSSLLLFVQCKKDNEDYGAEEMVPVRLEVPLDKSRSDFSDLFPFGKISWGNGVNVEYAYLAVPYALEFCDVSMGYYTQHLGIMFEMEAKVNEKMDKLVFEGNVYTHALTDKTSCTMYYFGNNGRGGSNVITYNKKIIDNNIIGKKISFNRQTGSIDELGNYHLAKALVKVKKNVNEKGDPISYDLTIESFKTMTSLALLDLERVTKLEGSAARLKSYTIKWTDDYVFEETYEYDTLAYIDVSGNVGKKSLIALLPTKESVTLECRKGKYEFTEGIKSNQVYLGGKGESIEDAVPLKWGAP